MASDSGDEAFLRMLQSHCPARQRLELKVGAQVNYSIIGLRMCVRFIHTDVHSGSNMHSELSTMY